MLSLFRLIILSVVFSAGVGQLDELQRVTEYHRRGYVWPIPEVSPNTPGWNYLMRRRLAQAERVEDVIGRYNAYASAIIQASLSPNFTENGWGLTRAPHHVLALLKKSLYDKMEFAREEKDAEIIVGANEQAFQRPLFIKQPHLNDYVLEELRPMHEDWSGVDLEGSTAYGLRIYRNQSILHMHTDRVNTHVISCILHVDHSEDSEPWPIFIEDFQGNTNEVVLESGDMLFYESSKCIHGRPKPFNGSWYTSLFVHYHPAVGWDQQTRELEAHYAVPPHWNQVLPPNPGLDKLEIVGTSFLETDCPYNWCNIDNTVKWFGPAKEGTVITTGNTGESPDTEEL